MIDKLNWKNGDNDGKMVCMAEFLSLPVLLVVVEVVVVLNPTKKPGMRTALSSFWGLAEEPPQPCLQPVSPNTHENQI